MGVTRTNISGSGEIKNVVNISFDSDSNSDSGKKDLGGSEAECGIEEQGSDEDEDGEEDEEMMEEVEEVEDGDHATGSVIIETDENMKGAMPEGSEVGNSGSRSDGVEVEGDAMGESSTDGAKTSRSKYDHVTATHSSRPRRKTKQPDRLHKNAFFDYVDNNILLSDDGATRDEEEADIWREILVQGKEEMDEVSESDFNPSSSVTAKGREEFEEEKNGKIIKPTLNGWAQIASPMYYVYLMQSSATDHWYIGYTNRPWARLLEHNGNLGSGANLGKHTRDISKRPWRQVFLIEGFENNIAAQSFEMTWKGRHLGIEEDQSTDVGHFIETLIYLLHKPDWARRLLDLRFFDSDSLDSWQRHVSGGGYYRQAQLKIIDNVHIDVPNWDKDKTSDYFKNHPLQIIKREVRDYSLHHEHLTRGRRLITESDTKHECTICEQIIGESDGEGNAIFAHGIDGPITTTPLTVICPSTGCHAVSHMTCLAHKHYQDERNAGEADDYRSITLPVPISGKCRSCRKMGDWKDYRREITWRLKASHNQWRSRIWRRQHLNRKARRLAERRLNEADRGLPVLALRTPTITARPGILKHGMRQAVSSAPAEMTCAIQNALCSQKVTGDIHKLTWYEKILLGDIVCTERIQEWLNHHIDNSEHMRLLPVRDDTFDFRVVMADVTRFLNASSVCWAHWESSRADEKTETIAQDEVDSNAWRKISGPGKGVFKDNDTYWMWEDDMARRIKLGGIWAAAVALRGRNLSPGLAADYSGLTKAAAERRIRITEEISFRRWDKPLRRVEDEVEETRQNAMKAVNVELNRLRMLLVGANPPPDIVDQIRGHRWEMIRLKNGANERLSIMDQRKGVAVARTAWKDGDKENAAQRRRIRQAMEGKRRYTLAGTPTAGTGKRRLGPRRNKPKKRERFIDDVPGTIDAWTRSAAKRLELAPRTSENSDDEDDEDMEDYKVYDSPSGSASLGSEEGGSIFSFEESSNSSTSSDHDNNESDEEQDGPCSSIWRQDPITHLWAPLTPKQLKIRCYRYPSDSECESFSASPRKRNPSKVSMVTRLRSPRAPCLLTPPSTPRKRKPKPGIVVPPYVAPTLIRIPGTTCDTPAQEAAVVRHKEAYLDRYFLSSKKRKGRPGFEGQWPYIMRKK